MGRFLLAVDAYHLSVDRLRRVAGLTGFYFARCWTFTDYGGMVAYLLVRCGFAHGQQLRRPPRGERVAAFSFGIHLMTVTTARGCNHFYSAIDFVHTLFSVRNAGRDHTRFRLLDEACAKAR
jgi:hypothetical protein